MNELLFIGRYRGPAQIRNNEVSTLLPPAFAWQVIPVVDTLKHSMAGGIALPAYAVATQVGGAEKVPAVNVNR